MTAIARISEDLGELEPADVLFVGRGKTAVGWYRCYLPALFMRADWVGVIGEPPKVQYQTGLVRDQTAVPNWLDYKVIVVQMAYGVKWLQTIRALRERGITVLYEVDDYLHGIKDVKDHDWAHVYDKRMLAAHEMCMSNCDGVICSTEFIARRYRRFNSRVWVCENAVDTARYRLTRPTRPMVNLGWAGGTGHARAAIPWMREVYYVLGERPHAGFVSIGERFADPMAKRYPNRAISIPFTMLDVYPAAMTMFDVALAPAGKGLFFRGKSDLRWLEAGALGVPIIADPVVYPKIEHGSTGFHASTPQEARELMLWLIDEPDLRSEVGDNAREHVLKTRDIRVAVSQWATAIRQAIENRST